MPSITSSRIDVREIAPRDRHAFIFNAFDNLKPGEALELANDHDPVPLRYQLKDRSPGQFEWTYLESGPDLWRIQIARLAQSDVAARQDACCSGGACCG